MEIYNFKKLSEKLNDDPKLYDRVVRFKRGERGSLKKNEIAAFKKIAKSEYDKLVAALNECTPKS